MKKLCILVLKGNKKIWAVRTMQDLKDLKIFKQEKIPIVKNPILTGWEEWRYRLFPPGKLYAINIQGETLQFAILAHLKQGAIEILKADGITTFYQVANIIPGWVAKHGLARVWCIFQDLINFKFKGMFINKGDYV